MEINQEVLEAILDAYAYEIVFVDLSHTVRYMNQVAKKRYEGRVEIGRSIFNCHNEGAKVKIEQFIERAKNGEDEMFQVVNQKTGEREFFVPVRNKNGQLIGYFERHEVHWENTSANASVYEYWKKRK